MQLRQPENCRATAAADRTRRQRTEHTAGLFGSCGSAWGSVPETSMPDVSPGHVADSALRNP
eukprot:3017990-Rhodomonas_salina.1